MPIISAFLQFATYSSKPSLLVIGQLPFTTLNNWQLDISKELQATNKIPTFVWTLSKFLILEIKILLVLHSLEICNYSNMTDIIYHLDLWWIWQMLLTDTSGWGKINKMILEARIVWVWVMASKRQALHGHRPWPIKDKHCVWEL